jgi:16S rRNA processing protein RimM
LSSSDLVVIAYLRRARGIKGEVIGDSLSSHPERFQKLGRVFLRKAEAPIRELQVERVWMFRGEPVFKFVGIDSMNDAEPLAGHEVCIPVSERAPLSEGEFYFSDILECEAFEGDTRIGRFTNWQESGSGQTWFEIADDAAGKSFTVPFHRAIFVEIDVAAKRVRLDLPAGLRELN